VLTRFGPMFQVERMGGAFVLAAMRVPEADWQRVLDSGQCVSAGGAQLSARKRTATATSTCGSFWPPKPPTASCRGAQHRGGQRSAGFSLPQAQEYFVEMKLAVRA
jgi:hypothetical protein